MCTLVTFLSTIHNKLSHSFLFADILLNFRTTFLNKKGEVVSEPQQICYNYLRGWFIVDLLAALPFDLIYASEVSDSFRVSWFTS